MAKILRSRYIIVNHINRILIPRRGFRKNFQTNNLTEKKRKR